AAEEADALAEPPALDAARAAAVEARALAPLRLAAGEDPFALRACLEALMWERVGLVRDAAGLGSALDEILELRERAARAAVPPSRRLNLAWAEALDLENLLAVAQLTARGAL